MEEPQPVSRKLAKLTVNRNHNSNFESAKKTNGWKELIAREESVDSNQDKN